MGSFTLIDAVTESPYNRCGSNTNSRKRKISEVGKTSYENLVESHECRHIIVSNHDNLRGEVPRQSIEKYLGRAGPTIDTKILSNVKTTV